MIQIEKNIPMPTPKEPKYPFAKMEVADSFFREGKASTLNSSAMNFQKGHPKIKLVVRKEKDGARCWRVK